MSIKLAVFDMAGTTVVDNNSVAKAFQKAFAVNEIEISAEEINPLMGYHKPLAIQMLLEKRDLTASTDLVDEIHADFENEMIDFYEYEADVKPMPGAENIFRFLKTNGIRVALNTGFSRNVAAAIVTRFQWKEKGLVDDFIGSNEVSQGRPYPYMINELMRRGGIQDAAQVLKVGDTVVDIEEGQQAGCRYNVAVTTGVAKESDLRKKNPTHIIGELSELEKIITA